MNESNYYLWDTVIKAIVLLATGAGAVIAYNQYQEQKEREFKKTYIERQLGVIDKVFELVAEAENGKDGDKEAVARKFFMLYKGPAKLYLGSNTYGALTSQVAGYFDTCVLKSARPMCPGVVVDCSTSPSVALAALSTEARKEISAYWEKSFEEIGSENAWIPATNAKNWSCQ